MAGQDLRGIRPESALMTILRTVRLGERSRLIDAVRVAEDRLG